MSADNWPGKGAGVRPPMADETPLSWAEIAAVKARKVRIYLCGPMSGLPDENYPAFNREAARLRDLGYHVENPAENREDHDRKWATYMRLALPQMLTCDMVAVLPDAALSRGGVIEIDVARKLDMPVVAAASIKTQAVRSVATWNREAA